MHVLEAGPLRSTWHPEHGMVGASLTHHGEELLGQRGGLEAYRAKGSAFGIPLLAPWANRIDGLRYCSVEIDPERVHLDENGLPKHGLMAGRPWAVEEARDERLAAAFESSPEILAVFPFPHRLRVVVELTSSALAITTELTATGVTAVPVAFGWHPLLTLPGVAREALELEVPAAEELVLDARGIPSGERRPRTWEDGALGARTADDEHVATGGPFVLRGGGRELRLTVDAEAYPVGHLWAPEGQAFVSWEPMTAPTNTLRTGEGLRHVLPGATFSARFAIEVAAG